MSTLGLGDRYLCYGEILAFVRASPDLVNWSVASDPTKVHGHGDRDEDRTTPEGMTA